MDNNKNKQQYISYFGNCYEIKQLAEEVFQIVKQKQAIIIERIEKEKQKPKKEQSEISNVVLSVVRKELKQSGFIVEGKALIKLYLKQAQESKEKEYNPDGVHECLKTVLEVEAGRAISNYHVLKDYIECLSVNTLEYKNSINDFIPKYLILVVPIKYYYGKKKYQNVFKKSKQIFKPLFENGNNILTGLCLIGYLLSNN